MTNRFVAILLTSLAGAVAGQASLPARSEVPDACVLLSRADIEETAGMAVHEGKPLTMSGGLSSCAFGGDRMGRLTVCFGRFPRGIG